ncbi:uncharacterized protein N7459_007687 [Penicillium hispanicum]|uniref:uncharacterized protein n=1 Tax=Penicillium hispanicum TaxID=1080232 RepID=UPI002540E7A9|nr:uncharacterized protein N7459_007687 [Penicillium hispanicum]KAJ5578723.1 hypothetical protein N7459_007687 [Penicillium hispanicum]
MPFADCSQPLALLGAATLAYITIQFAHQATVYLLPSTLRKRYNPTATNWALVTGATDGIGFGFCQELCARGFNVILHGRNRAKLESRARELAAEFPARKTGIVVLDVAAVTAAMDSVADEIRAILAEHGGKLSVLVNNVGGETKPFMPLSAHGFADVQTTINKNAVFMAQITRLLLPLLADAAPGLVVNVSSFSSYGFPYVTVYSSTKGFVDTFTRALEAECAYERNRVDVMVLRVGQVKTPGFDYVDSTVFTPTGRTLASAGLNRVGCGKVAVPAYFWHWVQSLAFDVLPRGLLMKATADRMKELQKEEIERAKKR